MCMMCRRLEETRYIDIYVFGSEGLRVCHSCEMEIVNFVRKRSMQVLRDDLEKRIRKGDA